MSVKLDQIKRSEIVNKIRDLKNGSIYSVKFVKKDGSIRTMNTIKGTSKGVKGVGMSFSPESRNLIPVYDLQLACKKQKPEACWRMININTVLSISMNKSKFEVIEDAI
jgi:hypothetical protein